VPVLSQTLNRYAYAINNPNKFIDPSGNVLESVWDAISLGIGAVSFYHNAKEGNLGAAALDFVGIVADTAALVVPFIPGGAGAAIRSARAVGLVVESVQKIDTAVNVAQGSVQVVEAVERGEGGWAALYGGMTALGVRGVFRTGGSNPLASRSSTRPTSRAIGTNGERDVIPKASPVQIAVNAEGTASGSIGRSVSTSKNQQPLTDGGLGERLLLPSPLTDNLDFPRDAPVQGLRATVLKHLAESRNARNASRYLESVVGRIDVATNFYQKTGWPLKRIRSHLEGIDFTKPVNLVTIRRGSRVAQWQIPTRPTGNYFADLNTSPSELGINPTGRVQSIYRAEEDTIALQSTAKGIVDTWSTPGKAYQADGGGIQYFVITPTRFKVLDE
jgi:hypothetical protein